MRSRIAMPRLICKNWPRRASVNKGPSSGCDCSWPPSASARSCTDGSEVAGSDVDPSVDVVALMCVTNCVRSFKLPRSSAAKKAAGTETASTPKVSSV